MDKNPLLKRQLEASDVKTRLLGHFGSTPGQNFIYVHLNRLIRDRNLNMFYISGPGHGGPAIVAQVYLEGVYTEHYPAIKLDADGIGRLFKQFSFPGGIPSHVAPETPGSIHEGGELGYSLSHAFGAVLDKPDLLVACVVGDGEAETGPLATSWHGNKFLNPKTDGAVLPILHLNGMTNVVAEIKALVFSLMSLSRVKSCSLESLIYYFAVVSRNLGFKIANPALLDRIPTDELMSLFSGYGYNVIFVEGSDPAKMHPKFAGALDEAADQIKEIQKKARSEHENEMERPRWPLVILKTPKGWSGPGVVDGLQIEGSWRSHQVPLSDPAEDANHLSLLEEWLK